MTASNKYSLDKVEEILVNTFTMATYSIIPKKAYNGLSNSTKSQSTWNPIRSLALK